MRKLKVEDSRHWEVSERAFAERKAKRRVCGRRRAHFVEKGADVYAKA